MKILICPNYLLFFKFVVWDVGGQTKIRPLWKHYYQNTQGLVYVVDSSDIDRIDESRDELHAILSDDEMYGVPVVIIANKCDLPNKMTCAQIAERLDLQKLGNNRTKWYIQSACAKTGEGIYEAMEKMASLAKESRHN